MTSKERARAFLQTHLGKTVSMAMLEELSASLEDHRDDERQACEDIATAEQAAWAGTPASRGFDAITDKILERSSVAHDGPALRAVPDLDEEVDDDSAE